MRSVVVVGPLPPPVDGASRVTRSVLDAVAERAADARSEVRSVDTSGRRSGPGYHLRRIGAHLNACRHVAAARRHGAVSVYLGGAGGLGLWYQLGVVVVARLLSAQVFFHHHSYSYLAGRRSRALQWIASCMGAHGAHVFLSEGMAGRFTARYRSRSAALILSNAAFVEPGSSARRCKSSTFRLIHVSNLTVEKGSVRVMEAFEGLRDAGTDVSLTLVGGTSDPVVVDTVTRLATRHPDRFRSLGHCTQEGVASALDASDLFLFPSTYRMEAQPLVVLEALARGVPVLATDRGALGDLLPADWLLGEACDLGRRIEDMAGDDWATLSARAAAAFEDSRGATADLAGPLLGLPSAARPPSG